MNGFKVSMKTSFEHEGDDMPNDGIDGGRRLKHIHQQGIIAPVKWVAKKNQRYSGLFEGASFGFARLSVTDFFTATGTMANPAVSLKMFRDGQPSGNLLFVKTFGLNESRDFFETNVSNHARTTEPEDDSSVECVLTESRLVLGGSDWI